MTKKTNNLLFNILKLVNESKNNVKTNNSFLTSASGIEFFAQVFYVPQIPAEGYRTTLDSS